jgi:hypothetical protein
MSAPHKPGGNRRLLAVALVALAGCAGTPVPPDWQTNAKSALEHATSAYLQGHSALEASEFARARREIAATGRADLLARAELMRCASHVASLDFEPCHGFEALRSDASPAELAYAAYLGGSIGAPQRSLLPVHHRLLADASLSPTAARAALQDIADPLARLVGAALLLRAGRADSPTFTLAIDTASAQGWRRPLLAWLHVHLRGAEATGDTTLTEQLRRRIRLVEAGA